MIQEIGLIGKKIGMTREFYKSGQSVPVTVIKFDTGRVIQLLSKEKNGYNAVQIGFGKIKNSKLSKQMKGYFAKKNTEPKKILKEFRVDKNDHFKEGNELGLEIFKDNKIGTLFYPVEKPIGNKKSWLSHAIQTVGKITLDEGASFAIKKKGASLLAVGVKNVEGNFTINQAVKIVNTNDKEVAKGLVSISSDKLRSILNNKEDYNSSIIVVHRDVLALS